MISSTPTLFGGERKKTVEKNTVEKENTYDISYTTHLHENEASTECLPVANRERAQIRAYSPQDSRHYALSVERRSPPPGASVAHFPQLSAHGLVIPLPIANLGKTKQKNIALCCSAIST